jgi:hypothetical protein
VNGLNSPVREISKLLKALHLIRWNTLQNRRLGLSHVNDLQPTFEDFKTDITGTKHETL